MIRLCQACSCLFLALIFTSCTDNPQRDVKVGRQHRDFVDDNRRSWDEATERPIAATIWYPAANNSNESEWTAGVFRFGWSAEKAPFLDTTRRPLILLSHGTGGSAAQLSWLAEPLVNAGFVVAAVNHHGNTAAEKEYRIHGFALPWERALDLSVLIDRLLADPEISPHIDAARIGAAGFSLGGYSVLATAGARLTHAGMRKYCREQPNAPFCQLPPEAPFTMEEAHSLASSDQAFKESIKRGNRQVSDPRIRAVYAIAPAMVPLLNKASLENINIPAKFVLSENDEQIPFAETSRVIERKLPQAKVKTLKSAGHYSFLASCSLRGKLFMRHLCKDNPSANRAGVHLTIASDATRFFSDNLNPEQGMASQELNPTTH